MYKISFYYPNEVDTPPWREISEQSSLSKPWESRGCPFSSDSHAEDLIFCKDKRIYPSCVNCDTGWPKPHSKCPQLAKPKPGFIMSFSFFKLGPERGRESEMSIKQIKILILTGIIK